MSFRIFAGNLAFSVTDEDLRTTFSKFGSVTYAKVILDRDTGKSRGFGFVEMDSEEAGKKALAELDGSDCQGRQLRLKEAEPRQSGGGGGPRRDGPRRSGPPSDRRGPPPRRDGPGGPRRDSRGDAPQRTYPGEDAAPQRRRAEQKKRPPGADERRGPAANQGKPQEKVRGGAKNRFRVHHDDDDDDIDLFGKFDEDDEYDITQIEGVELGGDDDSGGGIDIGGVGLPKNEPGKTQ